VICIVSYVLINLGGHTVRDESLTSPLLFICCDKTHGIDGCCRQSIIFGHSVAVGCVIAQIQFDGYVGHDIG
jgi:hypothetical protein